jgi:hypothetical protein
MRETLHCHLHHSVQLGGEPAAGADAAAAAHWSNKSKNLDQKRVGLFLQFFGFNP